ncbi:hypothetical protein RGUI_3293 [Rhodovulum sp. P5]|nr:hypothetical protein RGUI_3293 [Rhodovulum sp. P5]
MCGACGFRPVYGTGGVATALRHRIGFDDPKDKYDFALVERLEDRLGRAGTPRYRMTYDVKTTRDRVANTTDTTRYHLVGTVAYRLLDLTTGQVVHSGSVTNFSAYSTADSTVATLAAQRDAERRLMTVLADDLVTRLIGVAGTLPQ